MAKTTQQTMTEAGFRLACIQKDGAAFKMYSRCDVIETASYESYYHGSFDTVEEAMYSISNRCYDLNIKYIAPYAKRLIVENMYQD